MPGSIRLNCEKYS